MIPIQCSELDQCRLLVSQSIFVIFGQSLHVALCEAPHQPSC